MATEVTRVCGFMVVRRPHENYDLTGRGVFPARPAKVGDTYYGGVDRMPWFDLMELYYAPSPPKHLVDFRAMLTKLNPDATGMKLVRDTLEVARCLQWMGGMSAANEVIAVHSEALARVKCRDAELPTGEWLGLDVVLHSEGSLLCEGLFGSDFFGESWGRRLNAHGLFSSRSECEAYQEEYRRGVAQGRLEAMGPGVVDFIDVYRLSVVSLSQALEEAGAGST
jgi:hypothetical protein